MQTKEDGVWATNQDFIRYDQVEKRQNYQLAEGLDSDQFDDEFQVRTVDIGQFLHGGDAGKRAFATQLGDALHEIGFAILTRHDVDPNLYAEAERRIEHIFTSLTLDKKMRFRAERFGSVNQGYFPIKETSNMHPDLVEGWVFCRRAFEDTQSFWPTQEQAEFFRQIVAGHERLILPVMQSLLMYLGCDAHLFDDKLTGTNFGLRLNYYPPVSDADDATGAARLLGHEDIDLFTFLPAPRVEGLQILNRRNMKWVRIAAPPGSIILNTGDYMQRISNDIFPSTTHRVSKPRDPRQRTATRVSFPMAVYLWENEMLEVLPCIANPKYPPVKAIQFHTSITSKFYGDDYAVTEA
ncbi:MAG TPA: 2OG-Fe(II) oxygenase family protein [Thermoanaerobaculia bacterium]|jgi:isopenicillin N synthase-like dioxygenase|nr:2OG-Fe(II) oxygenase family protein [Thermoanaerobaculia bacterium]